MTVSKKDAYIAEMLDIPADDFAESWVNARVVIEQMHAKYGASVHIDGDGSYDVSFLLMLEKDDPRRDGFYGSWQYTEWAATFPEAVREAAYKALTKHWQYRAALKGDV